MKCDLCGKPVAFIGEPFAKKVTGWVLGPKFDSMKLRQDTGEIAHNSCVLMVQNGQDPMSPDLFGETNDV